MSSNLRLAAAFFMSGLFVFTQSCGTSRDQDSSVRITNGVPLTDSQFPEVVLVRNDLTGQLCTAVFVTDAKALTASQCTAGGPANPMNPAKVEMGMSIVRMSAVTDPAMGPRQHVTLARTIAVHRNPDSTYNWSFGRGGEVNPLSNRYDLAVLTFPAKTSSARATLYTGKPRQGMRIEVVGYGLDQTRDRSNNLHKIGTKRWGTNTVAYADNEFFDFVGASMTTAANGRDSSTSAGDIGAPVYIDRQLAGITTGIIKGLRLTAMNRNIDLRSTESLRFLLQNL